FARRRRVSFSPCSPPPPPSTLSLHDALPIYLPLPYHPTVWHYWRPFPCSVKPVAIVYCDFISHHFTPFSKSSIRWLATLIFSSRSEEHTSELQSRFDLVCRLLLEQKNDVRLH